MALTLRDAQGLTLTDEAAELASPQDRQALRNIAIGGTSQFGRGWESAGLGERANELFTQAAQMYNSGRVQEGDVLKAQAQDFQQQASQWAPTVQSARDVNSLSSAADWTLGAAGNVRSSVRPALGGLAGAAIGAAAAPLTGGLINPLTGAKIGGTIGAAWPTFNMEKQESVAEAMNAPEVMARNSHDDILNAGNVKGAVNTGIELLGGAPVSVMGRLLKAPVQAAAKEGFKAGVKEAGKALAKEAGGEFLTEGAQSLTGQATQNYLKGDQLSNLDYGQAFDEGAAGAVAGGLMSGVGSAGSLMKSAVGKGADVARNIADDPAGAAANLAADVGGMTGTGLAKTVGVLERLISSPHRAHETLVAGTGASLGEYQAAAQEYATHVMESRGYSEQEKKDATQFVTDMVKDPEGATRRYRDKLTVKGLGQRNADDERAIVEEINERTGKKASMMRASDGNPDKQVMPASMRMMIQSGLLEQDFSPKQLETAADLWRKQGVADKLLTATSEADGEQREVAIALMAWAQNGFADSNGDLFVPEGLLRRFDGKTDDAILSVGRHALRHGIITNEQAPLVKVIRDMAARQRGEHLTLAESIKAALPELSRDTYSARDISELGGVLKAVARHGTTPAQREALLQVFGSQEALAQAMSAIPADRSAREGLADNGPDAPSGQSQRWRADENDGEGGVKTYGGRDWGNDLEIGSSGKPVFVDWNHTGRPFHTKTQEAALNSALERAKVDGRSAWKVKPSEALREQYGGDAKGLYDAQTALLVQMHADKKMSTGEIEAIHQRVLAMPEQERADLLADLDRNTRFLRVEEAAPKLADRIGPDEINSFREHRKEDSEHKTISSGTLYLERVASAELPVLDEAGQPVKDESEVPQTRRVLGELRGLEFIDKETGKIIGRLTSKAGRTLYNEDGEVVGTLKNRQEEFTTSTHKLVKHARAVEERESEGKTLGSKRQGALGTYDAMLRGLAALLDSDGTFTGNVSYIADDGERKSLALDGLPDEAVLTVVGNDRQTAGDARNRAKTEAMTGAPPGVELKGAPPDGTLKTKQPAKSQGGHPYRPQLKAKPGNLKARRNELRDLLFKALSDKEAADFAAALAAIPNLHPKVKEFFGAIGKPGVKLTVPAQNIMVRVLVGESVTDVFKLARPEKGLAKAIRDLIAHFTNPSLAYWDASKIADALFKEHGGRTYAYNEDTKKRQVINHQPDDGAAINAVYEELMEEWAPREGGELGYVSEDTSDTFTGLKRAEGNESVIYRTSDGGRAGWAADALSGSYEGGGSANRAVAATPGLKKGGKHGVPSTGRDSDGKLRHNTARSEHGASIPGSPDKAALEKMAGAATKPVHQRFESLDNLSQTPEQIKAQVELEQSKDWVVDQLLKHGVPGFMQKFRALESVEGGEKRLKTVNRALNGDTREKTVLGTDDGEGGMRKTVEVFPGLKEIGTKHLAGVYLKGTAPLSKEEAVDLKARIDNAAKLVKDYIALRKDNEGGDGGGQKTGERYLASERSGSGAERSAEGGPAATELKRLPGGQTGESVDNAPSSTEGAASTKGTPHPGTPETSVVERSSGRRAESGSQLAPGGQGRESQVAPATSLDKLRAYLPLAAQSNVPLSNAIQKDISRLEKGFGANQKTAELLKAAEKQFGKPWEAVAKPETKPAPTSNAVGEIALEGAVNKASPPGFAREKELAKARGADFVFAPEGVAGSFASRLAAAAKAMGKLVDPNGKEDLRDKVVYVSVPGKGRGFTGIQALIDDVQKLLARGAIIRTDNRQNASTTHNTEGEGKLRTALVFSVDAVGGTIKEGGLYTDWQKPQARRQEAKPTSTFTAAPLVGREKKASMMGAEETPLLSVSPEGVIKAVTFKTKGVVAINRSVYDKMSEQARHALALHEIGVHYGMKRILGSTEYEAVMNQLRAMKGKSKLVDAAYKAVPESTHAMHVDEEAMAYLVEQRANLPVVTRLLKAVKTWFKETFGTTRAADEVFADDMVQIAESALRRYSNRVRQISVSNLSNTPKEGFVKLDFQKALNSDPFAHKLVDTITDNFDGKAMLTGSIAMSPQIDIYRDSGNQVHDLDFVYNGSMEELDATVYDTFKNAHRLRDIVNSDYTTRSFWISKDGRRVSKAVEGEKRGEVHLFDEQGNPIPADAGLAVDFFVGKGAATPTTQHTYRGADGRSRTIPLQHAAATMDAKFKMGREKDLNDALLAGSGDPVLSVGEKKASMMGAGAGIIVDGVAHPRENADGRAIYPTDAGIRDFWRWVNDLRQRRLVQATAADKNQGRNGQDAGRAARSGGGDGPLFDMEGRPKVLYHGTNADIEAFDLNHPDKWDNGWLGKGVYLSNDPDMANFYATQKGGASNVMPVYVALSNPYQFTANQKRKLSRASKEVVDSFTKEAIAKGYDGGMLDHGNGTFEVVVFDPSAVKSATGNKGGFSAKDARVSLSEQNARTDGKPLTDKEMFEQVKAAMDEIHRLFGDTVTPDFKAAFGDNRSGEWEPGEVKNTIRLALNGDVMSTLFHESIHEFFDMLKKHGNLNTRDLLKRVADAPVLNRRIERLLHEHPAAQQQVHNNPEEAAAFLYQFWRTGQITLGGEINTFFQKVKHFLNRVLGLVSETARKSWMDKQQRYVDEMMVDRLFQTLTEGQLQSVGGDTSMRDAAMAAMKKDTEAHEKRLDNLDKAGRDFIRIAGKLFFSAEAMLRATRNKYMVEIARLFNQQAGEKMSEQSLFDGLDQQRGIWIGRLDKLLRGYEKEDMELARQALSTKIEPTDRVAKEIVDKIRDFNDQMFKYITSRDVRRLDEKGKWVPVEKRADYFTRVWDLDALRDNTGKFREMLFKHHTQELTAIAEQASGELARHLLDEGNKAKYKAMGDAARKAAHEGQTEVTPEMVTDAIIERLLTNSYVDIAESESSVGLSPVATSVNRRELSWISDKHFDEFKSKDLVGIMTAYTASMVKRAEYTRVFGHGSERLTQGVDKAKLNEMGGWTLVDMAETAHKEAVKLWKKKKAAAIEDGVEFNDPFPTLMGEGMKVYTASVGEEKARAALAKAVTTLEQGVKAIMGMEGTLGRNASAPLRALNSALLSYQNVRLLPGVLFSSINDIMGITANGGELKDAWNALVAGMREIRRTWKHEKGDDLATQRAEAWGTVDPGSFLNTIGQTYGSMWMTDKMRRFNETFFRLNGMEGWNRGTRIYATEVAERVILDYQKNGYDKSDKAAVARFETLFGKNFDPAHIAVDANGDLDLNNHNNQAAVLRWVNSAIIKPNAAHRTIWGSDTRMAAFWQYKQFSYSFHRVMIKAAVEQARLGNLRPAMVLAVGYAPIAIAAGAVKEMLVPGEEPPWMQGGLDDYLGYGLSRSGIFGVPGMGYDALWSYNGPVQGAIEGLGGPTVGQLLGGFTDPVEKSLLGAMPAGGWLRRAA